MAAHATSNTAPTNVFDSVEDGPKGPALSRLGTGGPSSEEAMVHAGQVNTIDVSIRMQYIATAMFPWTSAQAPGTLLWTNTIHPKNSNEWIQHLSEMYNVWAGGFDYKFKVCGTGFHAGSIAFVRLPPNIRPESVTAPSQFTCYEYVVIDPKTQDGICEFIMDQRRFAYHYVEDDSNDKDAIGGHVAAYVLDPLVTSSTGSNNINIQVFHKPSEQFIFDQLKHITKSGKEVRPDEPEAVLRTFNREENNGTSQFTQQFTHYTIQPKSQVKPPDTSSLGMFSFDGKPQEPTPKDFIAAPLRGFSAGKLITNTDKTQDLWVETLKDFPIGISQVDLIWYEGDLGSRPSSKTVSKMTGKGKWQIYSTTESSVGTREVNVFYRIKQYNSSTEPQLKKNNDESFFCFTIKDDAGTLNKHAYQSQQLAVLAKQGELKKIMTPQEAMIVDMYDGDLDTPIRRLKLYYNGQVTTKGEDDQVTLTAKNYYFKFVQISRVGEPIPSPPNYEFNQTVSQWRSQPRVV